ncbi:MAG: hypothetical protein H6525_01655 [Actinobacteria bacterium]|nr:hypothetical protein [Actinomycetota bacterium]MCB9411545.1 hypothetical protein [Actinomycetota bacterium]
MDPHHESASESERRTGLGWPELPDPHPSSAEAADQRPDSSGLGWPVLGDGLHPEAKETR